MTVPALLRALLPRWLVRHWVLLLALGMLGAVWGPMVAAYPATPNGDGERFLHQIEAGKAALRAHELPLWNPWDCLGLPLWDHPESMVVSPLLLALQPLNGTATALVWQLAHALAGFAGMWLLARRDLRIGPFGAAFAATMWGYGATLTSQVAGAHFTFVSFWLTPWMLFLWRRAEVRLGYAVALGALLALVLYDGGTYPLPLGAIVLGLETLTRASPRRLPRIALAGLLTVVVMVGLSAARLLPLMEQFALHKRAMEPDWDHTLRLHTLRSMFLWPQWRWWPRLPGQQYVWGEYITFLGVPGLVLAGLGLLVALRRAPWLWVVLLPCFWLMLGGYDDDAPWAVLHERVFPFTAMRVPSRFRIFVFMVLVLAGGVALDRIPRWLAHRFPRRRFLAAMAAGGLGSAALLTVTDTVLLDQRIVLSRVGNPPLETRVPAKQFHYAFQELARWPDQPRDNKAWLGCRQEFVFGWGAPLWAGDLPQGKGVGATVTNVQRTPSTFDFDVEADGPARVLLNSAYSEGWRSSVGTVREERLLLVVEVPPGRHHVHLVYWPRLLGPGLVVTALTASTLLAIGIVRWTRRRGGRLGERRRGG